MHPGNVPETYWCVNPKTSEVEQLVTVMPDGVKIGWGSCVACTNFASRCICPQGIIGSRANEWIYIHALAAFEGERLEVPTVVDSLGVTSRALHWYKSKQKSSGTFTLPPARKPVQATPAPAATPSKPVTYDSKTDEAASDMAKTLTRSLSRKMDSPPKRSLKKSEPAPKRTLKRK